eukprot:6336856-Prymnesium_polylepis.1
MRKHNRWRFATASIAPDAAWDQALADAKEVPPAMENAAAPPRAENRATSLTQRAQSIAVTLGLDPNLPLKALVGHAYEELTGASGGGSLVDQVKEMEMILDGHDGAPCSSTA